jgi:hypothetical protein
MRVNGTRRRYLSRRDLRTQPGVLTPVLPLHAVRRELDGRNRYLLDDYTVSCGPSGYALHVSQCRIQESGRQQHTLLAVVNPTADLAFTRLEGEAVTALFAPAARQVLVEQEGSSDAVVVQSPRRSYSISLHGFYNRSFDF